jgi:tripartite-type tricarboxylate transporter receptor subunit TctC
MFKHAKLASISIAALAVAFAATPAQSVEFPCSTAKLIVPWSPGGGTDVIFRIFTDAVNKAGAKPQLQVVNISGQGGNKGAREARKASPDGCTLFAIHQSALTSYLNGRVDFTWDAFEPVVMLTRTPPIIGANPDVPWKNVTELIAAAKKAPGTILAGGTLGSTSDFWFLLLEDATGVKFKHISYDGTRQRMTALLAKNIQVGEINLAAAVKYIQSGQLKALGIFTAKRNPLIPNVPTMREQGIDLVDGTYRGVSAPKGTPADKVQYWAKLFAKAAKDPAIIASMDKKGTEIAFRDPAGATEYWSKTFKQWKRIATKVGLYKGK